MGTNTELELANARHRIDEQKTEMKHMADRIATLEAEVESERCRSDALKSSLDFETKQKMSLETELSQVKARAENAEAIVRELVEALTELLECTDGSESMVAPTVTTWAKANLILAKAKEAEVEYQKEKACNVQQMSLDHEEEWTEKLKNLEAEVARLRELLVSAENRLSHLMPVVDPEAESDDVHKIIECVLSRAYGVRDELRAALATRQG